MATGAIRVYADTSVFGGCFDEEFQAASVAFFEQVRFGRFVLVSSAAVREEIAPAPENVRAFFAEMLPFMETVETTPEARRLHEAYLRAASWARRETSMRFTSPLRPCQAAAPS